ncbi:MAG TPA: hypothetical protein VL172_12925, partial [Kofleriaceae bacterium]|nr:hypothetical protein [Kofleriaceae bacterium]
MKAPQAPLAIGLGALLFAGCADSGTDGHIPLPGDQDDNPDDGDGKADGWNDSNDPARLAQHLNYVLAELPRAGKLDKPVWASRYTQLAGDVPAWAETYWPTTDGSTNARWQGASIKSPLEKYDEAFNGTPGCATQPDDHCGASAKAQWDTYLACAGPAAKWQATQFQSGSDMFDGVDSNGNGEVDECSPDNDGIQGWWGLCHSWTPASMLEPEPQHSVTYNGVRFDVSDIKALIITVYDSTDALMLGGRCNAKEIEHDATGRATDPSCQDVNPGALHVILTNFLGINDTALAEDRTTNYEVWNQPLLGYNITKQDKVDVARANACIGATGDTYKPNAAAVELYEVEMTTDYLTEGYPSTQPLGMSGHVSHDRYHYILEVDDRGKVIGGEYCDTSKDHHPDFLWAPTGVGSSWGRNPNVDYTKVQQLIRMSRETGSTDPGTTDGTSFEDTTSHPIPDNDPAGATAQVSVDQDLTFSRVALTVDITHTYSG